MEDRSTRSSRRDHPNWPPSPAEVALVTLSHHSSTIAAGAAPADDAPKAEAKEEKKKEEKVEEDIDLGGGMFFDDEY